MRVRMEERRRDCGSHCRRGRCAPAAIDLAHGSRETHVGRFFAELGRRRLLDCGRACGAQSANNYNYISQTPYTLARVGAGGWARCESAGWAIARCSERLGRARVCSATLLGLIVGSVAATLTEDSGVVMPTLMLFAGALPALSLALLGGPTGQPKIHTLRQLGRRIA